MLRVGWQGRLARSLPFYYGWVVLAASAGSSLSARPVMSVATLSVFLVPMTDEFGWSRGLFSAAVSLGGVCAVAVSPLVGLWIDRHGSGVVVAVGGAIAGACALGLSLVTQSWSFYALYVPGRMAFASPIELGTSTAVSNWFIRRRAWALGLLNVSQGTGLAAMPMVAQLIIAGWDWRTAWAWLGVYTLALGVLPALLIARRPEDLGLEADPQPSGPRKGGEIASASGGSSESGTQVERNFTLRQALNTRAFWLLAAFSAGGFMVQAGVSLHQAANYVHQGLSGSAAALTVSTFAFSQVPGGLLWSSLGRRVPIRYLLALSGCMVGTGAFGASVSTNLIEGLLSAAALGVGVGGLHVLLRLTWADYYGRRYLGSIRGVTQPVQIAGQAVGPIMAGVMYDVMDSYRVAFVLFGAVAVLVGVLVLYARPPALEES